ncbi:MAG: hypothetical protein GEU73_12575 [Chloroflexi bacterium]|nr:hypothetical protein [Chloroflexota bacterium]
MVAVAERPDLRNQPDGVVFAVAQAEGRCMVTEDVGDYRPLGIAALQEGESHLGLMFTSDRRFPRHDPRTPGRLVTALVELMSQDRTLTNLEHWLA